MTPAVDALKRAGVAFSLAEYVHDPRSTSFGLEAAQALGIPAETVYKTLLARVDGKRLVVGIVPVSGSLNLKALAKSVGGKRAEMAPVTDAERATGYVAGGISPFGQKRRHETVLDASALEQAIIHVSGGRRGLEIGIAPRVLIAVLDAHAGAIAAP